MQCNAVFVAMKGLNMMFQVSHKLATLLERTSLDEALVFVDRSGCYARAGIIQPASKLIDTKLKIEKLLLMLTHEKVLIKTMTSNMVVSEKQDVSW